MEIVLVARALLQSGVDGRQGPIGSVGLSGGFEFELLTE
jgi:hypothetical protein